MVTAWTIGVVACAAAYAIGRARPLHRARSWAISYLLELAPERASLFKMLTAALLAIDFVARGHQAERRRPKSLRAAPRLSSEWQARADRAAETTPDAPTEEETDHGR